jgi:putative adenylate-forming enzyme
MMKRQIMAKPSRARAMRIFSVLSPISEIVAGLNQFQPAMLNGYATAISLLAQEQHAGRLQIHPVLVMTSSESLTPEDRERIKQAFDCTIADNYGCSEFVAIAAGCKHGWLHVNADWVILEPVDDDFRPVPAGETSSTVLLTNLINRVQPIIRYNLGDRITLRPDPCPCGNPFPAIRVEGRTDEILQIQVQDGKIVPVLPLALWAVIKQTNSVQRFQVIQTGPTRLKIRFESYPGSDRQVAWNHIHSSVSQFLQSQGISQIQIIPADEPPLRDPKSGKFRHIWTDFS